MKTLGSIAIIACTIGTLFFTSCEGSYYVTDQPVGAVYDRPVAPYAGAVWINDEWEWRNGGYHSKRGYWDKPRPGRTYAHGSWEHSSHGYHWNHGGWKR